MKQIFVNSTIAPAKREIHGHKTTPNTANTAGVDKTTVGNFDDTEVTRLEKLGYTKDQIKEYFKGLDNLTEIFDEPPTTLPVDDTTKPADADADVKALEKSGLPIATDDNVVVTGDRDKTQEHVFDPTFGGTKPINQDDLIEIIGKRPVDYLPTDDDFPKTPIKNEGELEIVGKRPINYLPTDDDFPKTPIRNEGELEIVDKRPINYLPTDDDFPRTPQPSTPTLPTATAPPAAQPPAAQPPAPTGPGVRIDPVQALQEFYNPFAPTPSKSTASSQTDTGPIQLMTDVFGTNIASAQKAGARGYGFSAGGDIDELLRLLRS